MKLSYQRLYLRMVLYIGAALLGDPVNVVIARVDVPARECELALRLPEPRRGRRTHGRQGWR